MSWDQLAVWYRWLEYGTFGGALARRRQEYLSECAGAKRALIVGDGDGRFTAALVKQNPAAEIDSIDLSGEMLRLAALRVAARGTVRFVVADALTAPLGTDYDLIATHFFLDCLTKAQVEQLAARVAAVSMPGAKWIISEFQIPQTALGRPIGTLLIRALYLCFRAMTGLRVDRIPEYGWVLASNGFRRVRAKFTVGGILVSELWERTSSSAT